MACEKKKKRKWLSYGKCMVNVWYIFGVNDYDEV